MSSAHKLSFNVGIATLTRMIMGVLGVAVIVLLTRNLGPGGFGNYDAVLAYVFIFIAFADFGLYSIFLREISRPNADEEYIGSNIFTIRLFVSSAFALIAVGVSYLLPYDQIIRQGIMIGVGFLVLSSFSQFFMGVFQKHLRLYLVSIADVIAKVVQLGLIILFVQLHISLLGFVAISVLAELVHFLIIFIMSRKIIKIRLRFDFDYWKKTLRISLPVAASIVLTLFYFKIDTVLLSLMTPAEDVGIYSAAYRILEQSIFFPAMYLGLIMPMLSENFMNKEKFSEIFNRTFNHLVIFASLAVVYLFVLSGEIINLIGGVEFANSVGVLKILSFSVGIIFLGNLGGNSLIALDLQKKGMWIYFSGAVLNFITNIIFIPKYSYLGAAWTTLATESFVTVIMFIVIFKHYNTNLSLSVAKKAVISGVLAALILSPIKDYTLFITLPAGAIIYFAFMYLFKGVTKEEIKWIFTRKKLSELL